MFTQIRQVLGYGAGLLLLALCAAALNQNYQYPPPEDPQYLLIQFQGFVTMLWLFASAASAFYMSRGTANESQQASTWAALMWAVMTAIAWGSGVGIGSYVPPFWSWNMLFLLGPPLIQAVDLLLPPYTWSTFSTSSGDRSL